jgi:hypothetical protein
VAQPGRDGDRLAVVGPSLHAVPRLYEGPYHVDVPTKLAEGTEQLSGTEAHLREGLVMRPAVERRSDVLGGRAIAKFVSEAYLTPRAAPSLSSTRSRQGGSKVRQTQAEPADYEPLKTREAGPSLRTTVRPDRDISFRRRGVRGCRPWPGRG